MTAPVAFATTQRFLSDCCGASCVPVGPFVADFYCDEMKLVIELDGDSHSGRAMADHERTDYLLGCGLRVVRFGNDDILRDLDAVLTAILTACGIDADVAVTARRSRRPSP